MRNLVVQTMVSLNGVMQAPGGPEEDPTGGFAHGGWAVPYFDDVMGEIVGEAMSKPFDLVLGRKTYEIFAAHWPYDEGPIADRLNEAAKHVASTTLTELDWRNAFLIEGDVPTGVARLKEQDGPELQVHGSSELIQTLLASDLVDELRISTFPVVVGPGKRLFRDSAVPTAFELVESRTSPSGVVYGRYRKAGEPQTGSMAFEEPTEAEVERRAHLS
jgi:dihydrofolate reductase